MSGRRLTNSFESEQSVLSALLIDPSAWVEVGDVLRVDDFAWRAHQLLFTAVADLFSDGREVDPITVGQQLEQDGTLAEVGGMPALLGFGQQYVSSANLSTHAEILLEKSTLRRLEHASGQIIKDIHVTDGKPSAEVVDDAVESVMTIAAQRDQNGPVVVGGLLGDALDYIEMRGESDSKLLGASTGLNDLDEYLLGLERGNLIVIAGRPSMGKTSLAMNMAESVAVNQGGVALVYSLEMPAEQIVLRMISSVSGVNFHKIRSGGLEDHHWKQVHESAQKINKSKLYIDDDGSVTPVVMKTRARKLLKQHGKIDVVVIDYLQLMQADGGNDNRNQEISKITRQLKIMAKELDAPVILLSQLNRSVEQRTVKRPIMSDLRESGAIEQDADVVLFVYREEYYEKDTVNKGLAEVLIRKQRNGATGDVTLEFWPDCVKFAGTYKRMQRNNSPMSRGIDE